MLPIQVRQRVGGAMPPASHEYRHESPLWWLLLILLAVLAVLFAYPARGATVSGEVVIPVSDGGYQPAIDNWKPARVRVEGTALVASVVATTRYTGTFTLTDVPAGPVTLIYEETPGEDTFTMDSRRLAIDVSGDVTGLRFSLVHHWSKLPSYPPPWYDRANYDIWEPYWVSAKVGFILFLNRGVSPMESELWRTTTGGVGWKMIGHWVHAAGTVHPDITGRSMLFVSELKGVITAATTVNFGMLRTGDGGATWTVIDLPNSPDTNGIATVHNYARIDSTRWIACGPENRGTYMGSGSPVTLTIWETADAGLTWQIKRTWLEDYAGCSAVDADKSGKAVLFATPYAWGGAMHRELRSTTGIWSPVAGNTIVTNSGYGTADLPMVGDVVWVRSTEHAPIGAGLFQSTDAGATFNKLNDTLPQYMDFVSLYRGLSASGGPMYSTYDGGMTWLKQSAGGGICCHGNYIWMFDGRNAVWKDGGVGDPNGQSDILMYVEPRKANFEVLPGVALPAVNAVPGDTNVGVLSLRFVNQGPMPLRVSGLKLKASGTGNDLLDVAAVKAWWDRDADGVVDPTDTLLASGVHPADDSELTLNLGSTYPAQSLLPYDVLVAYDFAGYVTVGGTFKITVTPANVTAATTDSGTTLTVAATAPAGTTIDSDQASLTPSTVALSSVKLSKTLVSGCKSVTGTVYLTEPAPATGVKVYLSDSLDAASVSATVTVPSGAVSKTFTVKTSAVAVNQAGTVSATLGPVTLGQPLTLRPMQMYSLSLTPTTVIGGNMVSGTAKLECKAGPGPVTVSLASTNAAVANPTVASISVPVGYTSAAFQVATTPVAVSAKATLSATANGSTKTKVLTVTP
jgi:hypothetical protein